MVSPLDDRMISAMNVHPPLNGLSCFRRSPFLERAKAAQYSALAILSSLLQIIWVYITMLADEQYGRYAEPEYILGP